MQPPVIGSRAMIRAYTRWLPVARTEEQAVDDGLPGFLGADHVVDVGLGGGLPRGERAVHLLLERAGEIGRRLVALPGARRAQALVVHDVDGVVGGHEADLGVGPG